MVVSGGSPLPEGAEVAQGPIIVGGGAPVGAVPVDGVAVSGSPVVGGPIVMGSPVIGGAAPAGNIDPEALAAGTGLSAAAANAIEKNRFIILYALLAIYDSGGDITAVYVSALLLISGLNTSVQHQIR